MATVKKTTTKKVDKEVKVTPEVEVETEVVETTEPEVEVAEDNTEIEVDTEIADVKNAPTEKNVRENLRKTLVLTLEVNAMSLKRVSAIMFLWQ